MMNPTIKKALLIYNPFSGKKSAHKFFPLVLKKLSEMDYRVTLHQLIQPSDMETPIKNACKNRWDAIFVAGGDGTINQSLQFLAKEKYRPNVGVFPFGTSNEFAKYIGMPCNMVEALSVIEKGALKPIDIGQIGNLYFANIAAAGWLSDITYKTPPSLKSYLGEWAYCFHFFKTFLMTKQSHSISIQVLPDRVLSDLTLFIIMNGNSVGPFERLIKNSVHNDGFFYLITCKKTKRIQLFISLLAIILNLPGHPSVITHTKIKSCKFTIPKSAPLNLDGEKAYVKSLHFKVLPNHLRVFSSH